MFLVESRRAQISRQRERANPFIPKQSRQALLKERLSGMVGRSHHGHNHPHSHLLLPLRTSKSLAERRWEFSPGHGRSEEELWARMCDVPLLPIYVSSALAKLSTLDNQPHQLTANRHNRLYRSDEQRLIRELIQQKLSQGFQLVDSERCAEKYEQLARLQTVKLILDDAVQTIDFSFEENLQVLEGRLLQEEQTPERLEGRELRQTHLVFSPLEQGFRTKQLKFNLLSTRAFARFDDWIAGFGEKRVPVQDTLLIPEVVFAVVFDPTPILKAEQGTGATPRSLEHSCNLAAISHSNAFAKFRGDLTHAFTRRGFRLTDEEASFELKVEECSLDTSRADLVLANKLVRCSMDIYKPSRADGSEGDAKKASNSVFQRSPTAPGTGSDRRTMIGGEAEGDGEGGD